ARRERSTARTCCARSACARRRLTARSASASDEATPRRTWRASSSGWRGRSRGCARSRLPARGRGARGGRMAGADFHGYGEILLDHYENPRNPGVVDAPSAMATVANPACGDRLQLSLRVEDGAVVEARFRTFGCPAAIAASSMTTVMIRGMKIEELEKVTNQAVADALGGLPPSKVHCSVLAEEAIREALADW